MRKVTYRCGACGYTAPSYLGRCPECQAWNTFSEQVSVKPKTDTLRTRALSGASASMELLSGKWRPGLTPEHDNAEGVIRLNDVRMETAALYSSGFAELDRVLGGGILPGGYVLIGGDPGIGKSTLMLQVASAVSSRGQSVLYVAGEESPFQIKLRADRLRNPTGLTNGVAKGEDVEKQRGGAIADIAVLPATNIHAVADALRKQQPHLTIVDSIQSMYCPDVSGTPGSIGQIRECAAILMDVAKSLNIAIFLVGHITKEGAVAGPKLLEHTVDAVLYFEGDKYQNLRILRSVKNRFGSTQEIGVFEMVETGLREIDNPSALFLSQAGPMGLGQPGSVVAAMLEGSRSLLAEIQALVGQSAYAAPRRVGNGIDANRLHQIVAVLERRLGLDFSRQDVYVNVVGGLHIDEPAADLAVAIAIIGGARNLAVIPGTAVAGEIGLTGEIRPVRQMRNRIREAARIGLSRMLTPPLRVEGLGASSETAGQPPDSAGIDIIPVATLADAVKACFAPRAWPESPQAAASTTSSLEAQHPDFAATEFVSEVILMEDAIS